MAKKQLMAQLTKSLTGKVTEPSINTLKTQSFARSLYDYSIDFDHVQSKKWALEFLEKEDKDLKKKLENVQSKQFKNLGFVCRIITRGGVIPYTTEEIVNKLSKLDMIEDIKESKLVIQKPKPKTVERINPILFKLDGDIDYVIQGKPLPRKFHCSGTKKDFVESAEFVNKQLEDIKNNLEYYNKTIAKNLEKFLKSVLETLSVSVPQRKQRKRKIVDPTLKLNFLKQDIALSISSIDPKNIIGATLLYIFDVKHKQLIKFVAEDGKTLEINKSRIVNIDQNTSGKKRVSKNIKEFIGTRSIINLGKNFDKIKTNKANTSNLINDSMLLLSAK